eukprot:254849-Chlamydomonas_euryale.AAC.1
MPSDGGASGDDREDRRGLVPRVEKDKRLKSPAAGNYSAFLMAFNMLLAQMNLLHFAYRPIDAMHHHYMPGSTMHYITAAHRKAVFILLDSIDYPTVKHYLFHQFQSNNMELWEMLEHIKASYGGHPADLRNDLNNLEF